MKIVIISGSHPRHLYVVKKVMETGLVSGLVLMQRESMVSAVPTSIVGHTRELYEKHFKLRADMEEKYFGTLIPEKICRDIPVLEISSTELNSIRVEQFIKQVSGDCIFTYGPDLLKDNILNIVNSFAFNLHGGLSHWYKGAATMFWPFYFLEPNYVGTTLHYITRKIDAGNIVQHSVPKLAYGDCMHEVACKAVVAGAEDAKRVFECMGRGIIYSGIQQKKTGKLFLEKDWRPEHLHLIYDLYEDKIVDMYLNGEISKENEPKIIRVL